MGVVISAKMLYHKTRQTVIRTWAHLMPQNSHHTWAAQHLVRSIQVHHRGETGQLTVQTRTNPLQAQVLCGHTLLLSHEVQWRLMGLSVRC